MKLFEDAPIMGMPTPPTQTGATPGNNPNDAAAKQTSDKVQKLLAQVKPGQPPPLGFDKQLKQAKDDLLKVQVGQVQDLAKQVNPQTTAAGQTPGMPPQARQSVMTQSP